jgi:hypothetical protein
MGQSNEILQFEKLRKLAVNKFRLGNSSVGEDPINWSGQEIMCFQEDLQEKVNTTISEKWFYTYFKQEQLRKLPRIDMLNLLAEYAGFTNWKDFSQKNNTVVEKKKFGLMYPAILAVIGAIVLGFFMIPKEKTYTFCFVDKDVDLPITSPLHVTILKKGQSPIHIETQNNGCFTYKGKEASIEFVVESPYYKTDTITRSYNQKEDAEQVHLSADEYALILHYFSTNNIEDWNQRRKELGKMIHDKAVIYQVFGQDEFGIDVLSKEAFINKITLPTSSVRKMKIIEIKREEGQITKLKFAIKMDYE